LVAGRKRVPRPATGKTAFRNGFTNILSSSGPCVERRRQITATQHECHDLLCAASTSEGKITVADSEIAAMR
jgi:hypothetical protein